MEALFSANIIDPHHDKKGITRLIGQKVCPKMDVLHLRVFSRNSLLRAANYSRISHVATLAQHDIFREGVLPEIERFAPPGGGCRRSRTLTIT